LFYDFALHSDELDELRTDLNFGVFTAVMIHIVAFAARHSDFG
jgi:hypothetical protein